MPGKLWQRDDALAKQFLVVEQEEGNELHIQCRGNLLTKEACKRAWAVDLEADGSIDKGVRLSLESHSKAHYTMSKMRRLA